MTATIANRMTPEHALANDNGAETRHELVDGFLSEIGADHVLNAGK